MFDKNAVLYHASSKTGVKADLARREAELEAKKKAFGENLFPVLELQERSTETHLSLQTSRTSNDEAPHGLHFSTFLSLSVGVSHVLSQPILQFLYFYCIHK